MKNLWKIALLSLALAICGACNDDDEADTPLTPNANNIAGTWQLTQFDGATLAEGSYVYVEFIRKDMKFEISEPGQLPAAHTNGRIQHPGRRRPRHGYPRRI